MLSPIKPNITIKNASNMRVFFSYVGMCMLLFSSSVVFGNRPVVTTSPSASTDNTTNYKPIMQEFVLFVDFIPEYVNGTYETTSQMQVRINGWLQTQKRVGNISLDYVETVVLLLAGEGQKEALPSVYTEIAAAYATWTGEGGGVHSLLYNTYMQVLRVHFRTYNMTWELDGYDGGSVVIPPDTPPPTPVASPAAGNYESHGLTFGMLVVAILNILFGL